VLDQFLEYIPAEKQEDYKKAIGSAIVLNSRDDAAKYIAEHPLLKSERDAIISRTTANYAEKFNIEKLPGLVEEEVRKRNPPKDPRDIQIAEMQDKFKAMERQSNLKEKRAIAIEKLSELGLPTTLADLAINENEELFASNIEKLSGLKAWGDELKKQALTGAVGNQKTPTAGANGQESFAKMTMSEIMAYAKISPEHERAVLSWQGRK
jgi:hypothetical protein